MSWIKLKKCNDDVIGKNYKIVGLLGEGGFGRVYLVFSNELKEIIALKTYQEEFFDDPEVRQRFLKEAKIWIDIGAHPNIVRVFFIDSIGRRPYIAMEVISSILEGQNTLEGFLKTKVLSIKQSIIWAVQFCNGMEYAYSKGLKAHRDIKPANIMIGPDKNVKISDFGLASALKPIKGKDHDKINIKKGVVKLSFSTQQGAVFGTPPYMSPEQFHDSTMCDVRSDIYSFGIVLFQMINKGDLPFNIPISKNSGDVTDYWSKMEELHRSALIPNVDSPLFPIVKKCLEKQPDKRYQSFKEMKIELEKVYLQLTGSPIKTPSDIVYTIGDLINKGNSYARMFLYKEALECFDQVIEKEPQNADALSSKGICLLELRHDEDALIFFKKAIEIDASNPTFWMNLGNYYYRKKVYDDALVNYAKARELNPNDAFSWSNAGTCFLKKEKYFESLFYFNKSIELDPELVEALGNKGAALLNLDRHDEAMNCFNEALKIDPLFLEVWHNKGLCYSAAGNNREAILCFNKAIDIDPNFWPAIESKGFALTELGQIDDAKKCFEKVEEIKNHNRNC